MLLDFSIRWHEEAVAPVSTEQDIEGALRPSRCHPNADPRGAVHPSVVWVSLRLANCSPLQNKTENDKTLQSINVPAQQTSYGERSCHRLISSKISRTSLRTYLAMAKMRRNLSCCVIVLCIGTSSVIAEVFIFQPKLV